MQLPIIPSQPGIKQRLPLTTAQLLYKQSQSIFTLQRKVSLEPTCLYIWTSFTGCLEGAHAWTLSFSLHSRQEEATSTRGHLERFLFSPNITPAMCPYMIIHTHMHQYPRDLHRAVNISKRKKKKSMSKEETERDERPLRAISQCRLSGGGESERERKRWKMSGGWKRHCKKIVKKRERERKTDREGSEDVK